MMQPQTIDQYIDAARAAIHPSSDRQIAKRLGVTSATVNAWRTKRNWPDDERMIALADLAGMPRGEALMALNRWRTKSAQAAETYGLLERLARGAAALAMAAVFAGTAPDAAAGTQPAQAVSPIYATIYYARLILARLAALAGLRQPQQVPSCS